MPKSTNLLNFFSKPQEIRRPLIVNEQVYGGSDMNLDEWKECIVDIPQNENLYNILTRIGIPKNIAFIIISYELDNMIALAKNSQQLLKEIGKQKTAPEKPHLGGFIQDNTIAKLIDFMIKQTNKEIFERRYNQIIEKIEEDLNTKEKNKSNFGCGSAILCLTGTIGLGTTMIADVIRRIPISKLISNIEKIIAASCITDPFSDSWECDPPTSQKTCTVSCKEEFKETLFSKYGCNRTVVEDSSYYEICGDLNPEYILILGYVVGVLGMIGCIGVILTQICKTSYRQAPSQIIENFFNTYTTENERHEFAGMLGLDHMNEVGVKLFKNKLTQQAKASLRSLLELSPEGQVRSFDEEMTSSSLQSLLVQRRARIQEDDNNAGTRSMRL